MKIYTEVIYTWDDAKGELVEESSKSFDYHGPLTLCYVQFIPAIIAGVGLAIQAYGIYKGQQAAEEAAEAERERRANLKRLAIKKFKDQQSTTLYNLDQLARTESRQGDIEKDVSLLMSNFEVMINNFGDVPRVDVKAFNIDNLIIN